MKTAFIDKSILIVDDDPISALLFHEMLEPTEATLFVAYDGCSALNTIRERQVDLVLLDIKLPDCNGYEILPKIKELRPDVVVIAQTANALVDDLTKCLDAGFDDYISKPIISSELFTKLEKHLGTRV